MMKPYSITRRLIATVLLIELVSALCVTAVAFLYERHAHFRSFDVLLRGRADSLLGAVQDAEDANDNVMLDGSEAAIPAVDIYEVKDADGRVLGQSTNWASAGELLHKKRSENDRLRGDSSDSGHSRFFETTVNRNTYRVIQMDGLRIVDPGDKGGGIRRYVTVYYGASTSRVWKAVFRVVSFYAFSSLIVLAATGLLMAWLLNRGLAPLRALATGAAQVSVVSWDFSPPESARQSKELSPLVIAMEELLSGLKRSFEQQRRFAGDAAHELKTSVAVVKSSLQLMQMKRRTAEEYEAGLERCLSDCERMEQVVAQMLTLARVEEGHAGESTEFRADVSQCVYEVIEQLGTMAEGNGVSVQFQSEDSLLVSLNPELLKLLSLNLLMNALQHSPKGTVISADVLRFEDKAEIRICDQGEGITPDVLPYIFERFSRSDPSRSRKTGGTGLGLAICKGITDQVSGSIELLSQPGRGTTVVVRLPLASNAGTRVSPA
jgi:signal transduction histidine kinase